MTLFEQLNGNLFSASLLDEIILLCIISRSFCYVQETFRTVSFQQRSLSNTHIWFFSVCHSVTAPRCCVDLKLLTISPTQIYHRVFFNHLTGKGPNFREICCFLTQMTSQVKILVLCHLCESRRFFTQILQLWVGQQTRCQTFPLKTGLIVL